jgi:hypothetical protein
MKTTDRAQKLAALEKLLQGDVQPARELREQSLTLDLDQFTGPELVLLDKYLEARGDGKASISELEQLFGRPMKLIPRVPQKTF